MGEFERYATCGAMGKEVIFGAIDREVTCVAMERYVSSGAMEGEVTCHRKRGDHCPAVKDILPICLAQIFHAIL